MKKRTIVRSYGPRYGNLAPPADLPRGPKRRFSGNHAPTAEEKLAEVKKKGLKPGMKISLGVNGHGGPAVVGTIRSITPEGCLKVDTFGYTVSPFKVEPCGRQALRLAKKQEAAHAR